MEGKCMSFLKLAAPPGALNSSAKKRFGGADCQYYMRSITLRPMCDKYLDGLRNIGISTSQLINSYYIWDYVLDKLRDEAFFRQHLAQDWGHGIRCAVQTDFSCWYSDPTPLVRANIELNHRYLRIMMEMGFQVGFNFNTALAPHLDLCEWLPEDIGTVFVDGNHNERIYERSEQIAFSWLVTKHAVNRVVIRTGKIKTKNICWLLMLCAAHDIPYSFFPVEYRWIG